MDSRSRTLLLPTLLASLNVFPMIANATSVETFVLAVGGQSQAGPQFQCATFGPATSNLGFFINVSVGVPTNGLTTCGIAGGFRTTTAASGPISDSTIVSTAFNALPGNTVNATASANARSGKVGAEAHTTFTGASNSLLVEGATSYGTFVETLDIKSPTVVAKTSGTVRLAFTVDGNLSVAGPAPFASTADVEVNYQLGNGPSFVLFRAQANSATNIPFAIAGTGAPLVGFTLAPGSFSGVGTVETFDLPIDWSTPTDLKFGVLASAQPGTGATADVNFLNSAKLTGIRAFANGQEITDFTVATGSGTIYTAQGVQIAPVPLPAGLGLLSMGMLFVGRRRRTSI